MPAVRDQRETQFVHAAPVLALDLDAQHRAIAIDREPDDNASSRSSIAHPLSQRIAERRADRHTYS